MKQSWTKRLLGALGVLAAAGLFALGASHSQNVKADTTTETTATQNVVLTKFGFTKTPGADNRQTDLDPEEAKAAWATDDATALSGVKFSVYDVTQEYWQDPTQKTLAIPSSQALQSGITNGDGQIIFADLATTKTYPDNSGKKVTHNAVYLFHEDQTRTGYATSADFFISLPAAAKDGNVYVYPKNTQETTYAHHFIKKGADTKNPLAGAEFQIKDANGNYLALVKIDEDGKDQLVTSPIGDVDAEKDNYRLTWVKGTTSADNAKAMANATIFTSDNNGYFGLNGFKSPDAQYTAVEVKAPAGYDVIEKGVDFKADNNTDRTLIEDKPEGLLPHTGGAGIIGILAAGAALFAIAFVGIKKRQAR